jgi:prepilin-type N-terminal cleavage/methylation domain-containing protein
LTLIEVLVAIVIISIVATASVSLCISGLAAAATQERRQIAVTIASSTMETISGTAIAGLYTARTAAAVQAGWTANSSVPGVSQTYPVWDVAPVGSPAVPVGPTTVAQAGTNFTVETVIGVCFQPLAGGDCTAPGATATGSVPAVPATAAKLIRAIVIVKWTAGRSCPATCSYVSSTLIDPSTDLNWISHD